MDETPRPSDPAEIPEVNQKVVPEFTSLFTCNTETPKKIKGGTRDTQPIYQKRDQRDADVIPWDALITACHITAFGA